LRLQGIFKIVLGNNAPVEQQLANALPPQGGLFIEGLINGLAADLTIGHQRVAHQQANLHVVQLMGRNKAARGHQRLAGEHVKKQAGFFADKTPGNANQRFAVTKAHDHLAMVSHVRLQRSHRIQQVNITHQRERRGQANDPHIVELETLRAGMPRNADTDTIGRRIKTVDDGIDEATIEQLDAAIPGVLVGRALCLPEEGRQGPQVATGRGRLWRRCVVCVECAHECPCREK